ncbi:HAD family hydrolase [Rummeliibacillus pycnus]|uniref:HAD family hydrolase n=1 Tax=Rummeliibacillus pycnus TaxID=101070 RepID=UPI0037CABAE7
MVASVIVLDLDGTLLNSNKQVSNRNLNAVLNCYKSGKRIIIATARPPRSVKTFLPKEILEVSSFVFYNGAFILDKKLGLEEHNSIPKENSTKILAYCNEFLPQCKISIEEKDKWYSNQEISDSSIYNLKFSPNILPTEQLKEIKATKILLSDFDKDKLEKLQLILGEEVNLTVTDNGKLIQIMNKDISKKTGVLRLCSYYGVNPSEVIVFGDDYNDIEMFRLSGYAVAMSNAVSELKDIANEVTDTNDNDGVAKVLERII